MCEKDENQDDNRTCTVLCNASLFYAHRLQGAPDWMGNEDMPMKDCFQWGPEGKTSGIWMWSEPFEMKLQCDISSNGTTLIPKDTTVAVLVMDTQGTFDCETTMTRTVQCLRSVHCSAQYRSTTS